MCSFRIIKEYIVNLIYPPRCAGCGKIISFKSRGAFCLTCAEKWESYKNDNCVHCGQPIRQCWCGVPGNKDGYVDEEHHLVAYDKNEKSIVNKLIYNLKDYNEKRLFDSMAQEMFNELYFSLDYNDLIVTAVPRSPRNKLFKGHDQSINLAKSFCILSKLDFADVILHSGNIMQKKLDPDERTKNAQKSYKIKNGSAPLIKNKNVILIDDVVTTGATVIRCARLLKMRGAKRVIVFCVAKNKH